MNPQEAPKSASIENKSNCKECSVLRTELNQLKIDYKQMECENRAKINQLEINLNKAKAKLNEYSKEKKNLKKNLDNAKSSKIKLKNTLKKLQEENLLCQEAVHLLEV